VGPTTASKTLITFLITLFGGLLITFLITSRTKVIKAANTLKNQGLALITFLDYFFRLVISLLITNSRPVGSTGNQALPGPDKNLLGGIPA
jgi:hypothetical protein